MTRQTRILLLLIAAQSACLTLGFWIHHRLLVSTVLWQQQQDDRGATSARGIDVSGSAESATFRASGTQRDRDWAEVSGELPAAYGIAFVWVAGLQGAVAYLFLSRVQTEHDRRRSESRERSLQRTQDLIRTRDAIIFGLATLAESRDPDTGHHLERIALYSTRLATALSSHPEFRGQIAPAFLRLIGISSALHDIGKVGVEDAILLKPGRLSSEERFRMEVHSAVGADCIRQIERRLGNSNFLSMAREIALYHHERWDGCGYPHGLVGDDIPLSARIVAIADVYDALSSPRVYKRAYSHEKCVAIIREGAGTQFDPRIVSEFLRIAEVFRGICQRFADSQQERSSAKESLSTSSDTGDSESRMTEAQERVLACVLEPEADVAPVAATN